MGELETLDSNNEIRDLRKIFNSSLSIRKGENSFNLFIANSIEIENYHLMQNKL